jgi:16S rRNA processing protein RimM
MSSLESSLQNVGDPRSWTVLAHLLRPQGRKGEVLAELLTDFPARFTDRPDVFLARPDFTGPESDARAIRITGHWLPVGRNQGRIVLTLAGIDSIELAETLAGLDVIVPTTERVELDEDEEYIDDLIGCEVFDLAGSTPGQPVGTVTGVDFPTTPDGARRLESAAPLLTVLSPGGDEVLIPYVQNFIDSLSVEDKRIEMRLPVGLLELNRTPASSPAEPANSEEEGPTD